MRLRCDDISVLYANDEDDPDTALTSVTLEIQPGERLAVVGPNGSGKSTLALCLAGLIRPTRGRLIVDGVNCDSESPLGAIVFQAPDDNLIGPTAFAEMALTLEHVVGGIVNDADVTRELARCGLESLAERAVDRLSGGEKQKLALACALASRKPLIVLDEPTSHLDPPGRRDLLRSLTELTAEDGKSGLSDAILVLVTQYENEARLFPRIVHLDAGSIVYDGPGPEWPGLPPVPSALTTGGENPESDGRVVVRVNHLTQIDTREWPAPEHPLTDINVEIHTGEAIALCGPTGAGKTTLGFHLAGLLHGNDGTLEFPGGNDPGRAPVVLIQFPERQLFAATVREDVSFGPIATGMKRPAALAAARLALGRVGLQPEIFDRRSPFSLSGGQKRRAAIAGVAVMPAPLYILDEPTAALDAEGLVCVQRLCRDWLATGAAIVMISHDLDWLRRMCGRVWVMDKGRIIFDGGWTQLDNDPDILRNIGFAD